MVANPAPTRQLVRRNAIGKLQRIAPGNTRSERRKTARKALKKFMKVVPA